MVANFAPLVLEHFAVWAVKCTCVMSVKYVLRRHVINNILTDVCIHLTQCVLLNCCHASCNEQ